MCQEPAWLIVIMMVNSTRKIIYRLVRMCFKPFCSFIICLHVNIFSAVSVIDTCRKHKFNITVKCRICFLCVIECIYKRFIMFKEIITPLFISDTDIFEFKRFLMSHCNSYFTPFCSFISTTKLNKVKCILNVLFEFSRIKCRTVSVRLTHTAFSTVDNRYSYCSYILSKLEILIKSKTICHK